MVRKILFPLLVLAGLALAGCGEYGQVEQGRTVAFNKDAGTVTIIKDNGIDEKRPQYTVLPAHTFQLPSDPAERGADPTVGMRLNLDANANIITMYNPKTQQFEKLPFTMIQKEENVSVRRQHPLVYDPATKKARVFPVVDAAKKTVTIYSSRQQLYTIIKLSDEDFARYEEKDWGAGDEVRIYYKEAGKALRFMNVSKTDITRR
ncbi:MAG: DUF4881 domain-containing protein [Desulfovibrio sp.]|jgi:hypothetical protein|nr:DUF4881 domain-containing protein [Desulfovibrio sp.]